MSNFKERLNRNAEDFDQIIVDLLSKLDHLEERDRWLYALEAAGVDNWDGFGDAQEVLEEWDKEDEKVAGV